MLRWALLAVAESVTVSTCSQAAVSMAFMQQPTDVVLTCSGTIAVTSPILVPPGGVLSTAPGRKVTFSGGNTSSVFLLQGSASLQGFVIKDGYSDVEGGCVQTTANTNVTLSNLTFMNCRSGLAGGGVVINGSVSASLNNLTFWNNWAGDRGGGLHVMGQTTVEVSGSVFTANQAQGYGGGAASVEDATSASFSHCSFESNVASAGIGGALYIARGASTLSNNVFMNNSAFTEGGAFACDTCATTNLEESWFFNNVATSRGGAVVYCGSAGEAFTVIGGGVCDSSLTLPETPGPVAAGVHAYCEGDFGVDRTSFSGNVGGSDYQAVSPVVTIYQMNVALGEVARGQCDLALNITLFPPTPEPFPNVVNAACRTSLLGAFLSLCLSLVHVA